MTSTIFLAITLLSIIAVVVLAIFLFDTKSKLRRYSKITDVEEHLAAQQQQCEQLASQAQRDHQSVLDSRKKYAAYAKVLGQYRTAEEVLKKTQSLEAKLHELGVAKVDADAIQVLKQQCAQYMETEKQLQSKLNQLRQDIGGAQGIVETQSYGIYQKMYDFEDPADYKDVMDACVQEQRATIKDGTACTCDTEWQVDGDFKKGKKMIDEQIKLMLRAFNGECNAAIAKVKHSNYAQQEKKIRSAFDMLNKLGKTKHVAISPEYRDLRIDELRLAHERELAKQEQKEREREIREQMREEAKAQKEIEDAKKIAEQEEAAKEKALIEARKQLADEHGAHNEKLEALVAKLEDELKEAIDRKAKAIARAQLTRSGHVYILSNLGTMGERVYKIGMTRRLVPDERVKELGDASVPFPFDVHAMIYSEDAPSLESALHQHFEQDRVNKVNLRKEYFNTTLQEIQDAVANLHIGRVTFVIDHPAEQYRESLAIARKRRSQQPQEQPVESAAAVAVGA